MDEKQHRSMKRFMSTKQSHRFFKRKIDYTIAEKFLRTHLPKDVVNIIITIADKNDSVFEFKAYPDTDISNFTNDSIELELGYMPRFSIVSIDGNGKEICKRVYDENYERVLRSNLYGAHLELMTDYKFEFDPTTNLIVWRYLNYSILGDDLLEEYDLCLKERDNIDYSVEMPCNTITKPYYHAPSCMSSIKDRTKGIPNISMYSNLNEFDTLFRELKDNLSKNNFYSCVALHEFGKYAIAIWNSLLYIVSEKISNDNHKILNILYADEYDLQHGDMGSHVYLLNEKHILIWNTGDVSSVVIVKNQL